jgi:hypothetical protein
MFRNSVCALIVFAAMNFSPTFLLAQEKAADKSAKEKDKEKEKAAAKLTEPPTLTRMSPEYDIWVDPKRKIVIVDGKVALRDGLLEMFACPKGTKEHESIVAVNCKAQFIHGGLIAVGAEPGHPVSFTPEYKSATGPVVQVRVLWKDEKGNNRTALAQEWVQHTKTGQQLEYSWVFGGSEVHVDETTGKKTYLADGGDLICVSNFTSAMLDLPIPSSDSNAGLSFRAFTERIPPIGTPVRLVLEPQLPEKPANPPITKPAPTKTDKKKSEDKPTTKSK